MKQMSFKRRIATAWRILTNVSESNAAKQKSEREKQIKTDFFVNPISHSGLTDRELAILEWANGNLKHRDKLCDEDIEAIFELHRRQYIVMHFQMCPTAQGRILLDALAAKKFASNIPGWTA